MYERGSGGGRERSVLYVASLQSGLVLSDSSCNAMQTISRIASSSGGHVGVSLPHVPVLICSPVREGLVLASKEVADSRPIEWTRIPAF